MRTWLQKYTCHTEMTRWIYLATGAGALPITLLTVSYQSLDVFFQAEDGIRDLTVTGVQTCALPIYQAESGRGHARPDPDVEGDRGWEQCRGGPGNRQTDRQLQEAGRAVRKREGRGQG